MLKNILKTYKQFSPLLCSLSSMTLQRRTLWLNRVQHHSMSTLGRLNRVQHHSMNTLGRDYLRMRSTVFGKNEWGRVSWRGLTMEHPVQCDTCSCWVIVTMMAKAVIEAYPSLPQMSFNTLKTEIALQRRKFALDLLNVLDPDSICALCSASKPPGTGPPITNWIQCNSCERWFHEQCLNFGRGKSKNQGQEHGTATCANSTHTHCVATSNWLLIAENVPLNRRRNLSPPTLKRKKRNFGSPRRESVF
ncbi:uncharacterized protein LOC133554521 isoform X3 [Nerophis ophidion]|uniref:uncharacterized protein LOC133554521 isoform X3 n=1 Tax=Nerophis ophidion TaxID=159077 RepID=UPI002AE00293|nr:uncharacterized protein LOC133554521 isoform X3 [Nerophis ophidion]